MYRSLVIYKKMFICLCREIYKCKREGLDVSWLGMNSGDPHVQGWNCNSLTEDFKMQKQFIHEPFTQHERDKYKLMNKSNHS